MSLKRAYAKGYRNEKRSRELLESEGALVVEARGSHGLWDLVALWPDTDQAAVVQVKTNRPPGRAEMQAMTALRVPSFCKKLLHIWKDRVKLPEIIEIRKALAFAACAAAIGVALIADPANSCDSWTELLHQECHLTDLL